MSERRQLINLASARGLAEIARTSELTILERMVNGQPGLIAQSDGVTVTEPGEAPALDGRLTTSSDNDNE